MRVMRRESHGDPDPPREGYRIGLFQLGGFKCNAHPAVTDSRLAYKLWRSRGWQPWNL